MFVVLDNNVSVIASPDLSGRGNHIAPHWDCTACSEAQARNPASHNDKKEMSLIV